MSADYEVSFTSDSESESDDSVQSKIEALKSEAAKTLTFIAPENISSVNGIETVHVQNGESTKVVEISTMSKACEEIKTTEENTKEVIDNRRSEEHLNGDLHNFGLTNGKGAGEYTTTQFEQTTSEKTVISTNILIPGASPSPLVDNTTEFKIESDAKYQEHLVTESTEDRLEKSERTMRDNNDGLVVVLSDEDDPESDKTSTVKESEKSLVCPPQEIESSFALDRISENAPEATAITAPGHALTIGNPQSAEFSPLIADNINEGVNKTEKTWRTEQYDENPDGSRCAIEHAVNSNRQDSYLPIFSGNTAEQRQAYGFNEEEMQNRYGFGKVRGGRISRDLTSPTGERDANYGSDLVHSTEYSESRAYSKYSTLGRSERDRSEDDDMERREVKSISKTTSIMAGDEESTDALIKRILAEARGEIKSSEPIRNRYRVNIQDGGLSSKDGAVSPQDGALSQGSRARTTNTEEALYSRHALDAKVMLPKEPEKEQSLLQRRLAAMERDERTPLKHQRQEEDDEYGFQYSSSKLAKKPPGVSDDWGTDKRSTGRQALLQKQSQVTSHDEDEERSYRTRFTGAKRFPAEVGEKEDEDEKFRLFRRRQEQENILPDEDFEPIKSEETDKIVQERTRDIRSVVENQNTVLHRLKSTSDSFDELDDEIRALKQEFLDSQMRRSMILDEIEFERMYMEQLAHDDEARKHGGTGYGTAGKTGYSSRVQRTGAGLYRPQDEDDDDELGLEPLYKKKLEKKVVQLDGELEEDRIGKGYLSGLALHNEQTRGKTAYDSESKYDRMDDKPSRYSHYEKSDFETGLARKGRSQSLIGTSDDGLGDAFGRFDYSRSRRPVGGFVRATDADDLSDVPVYRSPNLPNYRKYDMTESNVESSSTRYSSRYREDHPADRPDDTSAVTSSRLGRFSRSSTIEVGAIGGTDTTSSYKTRLVAGRYGIGSAAQPSFSSKFLNKVREKKAAGEEIKSDKPFTSRFLGKSFDAPSGGYKSDYKRKACSTLNNETTE